MNNRTKNNDSKNINKGSITVEMCLVMPLVLMVVFNMIMIIINLINQSVVQSSSYVSLYSYSGREDIIYEEALLEKTLKEKIVLNSAACQAELKQDKEEVVINIKEAVKVSAMDNVFYQSEEGKGTTRLRRWQLYGDVLQE